MAISETNGEFISLEEAAELTARYQEQNPDSIKGLLYDSAIFKQLLSQNGCEGIRIYFGESADREKKLVLVGVNSKGDDILDLIADMGTPCPFICGSPNRLNS